MGVKVNLKKLNLLDTNVEEAVNNAFEKIALAIQGDAARTAPLDEGTLRRNIDVRENKRRVFGQLKSFMVKAGGQASDYAEVQHENTRFRHRAGKAKYLEDPLEKRTSQIFEAIEFELNKVIK